MRLLLGTSRGNVRVAAGGFQRRVDPRHRTLEQRLAALLPLPLLKNLCHPGDSLWMRLHDVVEFAAISGEVV